MIRHFAILFCVLQAPILAQETETKQADPKLAESKKEEAKFTESGHSTDPLDVILKRVKKKEAVIIDVREDYEWDEGHLKGAKFVPLSEIKADKLSKKTLKGLPKDKPIYCHCFSGGRVLLAGKLLKEKGYDMRPIKAGYPELLKAGFKEAKPPKKKEKGKSETSPESSKSEAKPKKDS
ncbi:MAG: rhodanese-like domain-containing protein [Planctomycetota bacterium]|nr:rhodanese-like domain-containing protein [Planctomycetota bacterium]